MSLSDTGGMTMIGKVACMANLSVVIASHYDRSLLP